jgi:hypothetical protein
MYNGGILRIILAYLDAGTGSLLLQALLGGLAGLGVLYKTLRQRVSRRNKNGGSANAEPSSDELISD